MKFLLSVLIVSGLTYLVACNNESDNKTAHTEPKTLADTLLKDVDDGHIVGMGKMGRLTRAEQETQRILDSLSKLPAKAKKMSAPYQVKLDSLLVDLKYAESAMDKWMNEFNRDSAINDLKKRIEYLSAEKVTIDNVKESILSSLQKADSLIKKKI